MSQAKKIKQGRLDYSCQDKTAPRLKLQNLVSIFRKVLEVFPSEHNLVELTIVSPQEMQSLNKKYRGKNSTTDVLSFTIESNKLLGSIVIDWKTALKQSKKYRHSYQREVLELFLHGVLHLRGLDHETEAEAFLMKKYEYYFLGNKK